MQLTDRRIGAASAQFIVQFDREERARAFGVEPLCTCNDIMYTTGWPVDRCGLGRNP